ncbi:MerR family transcriptional regulator [Nocardioides sp. InS609-2]|uniref:MerR family transcriptional regulator n=1 Tax=Nocardioides sp. InS609-2 TaxID=2760705 RepID=UPI0020C0B8BB|nr:MerR family transcriptional regulator [Nocardioides sp. InS609-2]
MWMSELSRRSGVPVATVKFYLREGLLAPGEAAGATRAHYNVGHVDRLRLVRALVEVAGMSLERVRAVLVAVDDDRLPLGEAVGGAHVALSPEPANAPSEHSTRRVADLAERVGWSAEARHATALAAALDAMDAAGQPLSDDRLDTYARAAATVAGADLEGMDVMGRDNATTYAVLGTLLSEPVLVYLRRMAQADLAQRRLGG